MRRIIFVFLNLFSSISAYSGSCSAPLPPDQEIPLSANVNSHFFEGVILLLVGIVLLALRFIMVRRAKRKK